MSQSQMSLNSDPLIRLEETFKSADEDNDDLLNKTEFTKFVEVGYGKQCPPGMYESVCEKFKSDPQLGVNWNTAKTIYVQANNNNKKPNRSSIKSKSKSNLKLCYPKPETSHSYTNSNSLIIRHNSISISSDTGGNDNNDKLSQYKLHRRTSTLSSNDLHTSDTSSMIVDILDSKNKTLQNKLIKERNKRKKTEEIAQSLLNQNDEYKLQINTLKNENIEIKTKYKLVNEQNIKLESNINEYKINLKHITSEKNQIKKELNEAYEIYNKIEKDNNIQIKKLKLKHKTEMEKLCNGFLESLGAKPGTKDINSIIKTLKINNNQLQQTVDTLSESLNRKQQSLIEALQAVDNITKVSKEQSIEIDTAITQTNDKNDSGKNKIKNKLKEWNQRRKSYALQRKYSHTITDSDFIGVSEVKSEDVPFKGNIIIEMFDEKNNKKKLSISSVKNVKEMQFLSQQLTDDVVNKRQSIQNLEMANTVLFEQMQQMKKKMNDMKVAKNKYDSEHMHVNKKDKE